MTDEEAKTQILARLSTSPVTVDMVQTAANAVLAADTKRLTSFTKWLERNGQQFCESINTSPAGPPG